MEKFGKRSSNIGLSLDSFKKNEQISFDNPEKFEKQSEKRDAESIVTVATGKGIEHEEITNHKSSKYIENKK